MLKGFRNANIYKPRYKIAFLGKNKVWAYKNSRLRRFVNIRGRKMIRKGYFKRIVIVFNTIKWILARKQIRVQTVNKKQRSMHKGRYYKDFFYEKQMLKKFYGKQNQTQFQHFLKRYLNNAYYWHKSFVVALERRVDITLFRLRVLPTIFACNQFIHHYGILINNKVVLLKYSKTTACF